MKSLNCHTPRQGSLLELSFCRSSADVEHFFTVRLIRGSSPTRATAMVPSMRPRLTTSPCVRIVSRQACLNSLCWCAM